MGYNIKQKEYGYYNNFAWNRSLLDLSWQSFCYLGKSLCCTHKVRTSQVVHWVKNLFATHETQGDMDSIPGLGRSLEDGNGIPLQYSCLENPMDRGAWRAIVHGITKSWTRLRQLSTQAHWEAKWCEFLNESKFEFKFEVYFAVLL